jgi:hypothetical protein
MGIAMSHFELTAREAGISGSWKVKPDAPGISSWDYMVTWQET